MGITIKKYDNLYLKIETKDFSYYNALKEHFTAYADGFQYMYKFKTGMWDGKICLFNGLKKTLPLGLITDLLSFNKKSFPNLKYEIDPDLKKLFSGKELKPKYDLSLYPREYQEDCIKASLKFTRGIIRISTAGGKSAVIAYIIKTLYENNITKNHLIICPTKSLVEQFYKDLKEYGIKNIGRVYDRHKEFDKTIVISTWQSLQNRHDTLLKYDCVIIDECHVSGNTIRDILSNCKNAIYRLGFTGTLPTHKLDLWNVKSFLGPVLREYNAKYLAKKGYISECNIKTITMNYPEKYDGNYNDVKDDIFKNKVRMEQLKSIVSDVDSNILVLVGKVEKEGKVLKDYLKIKGKETVFLHGSTSVDIREEWRNRMDSVDNTLLKFGDKEIYVKNNDIVLLVDGKNKEAKDITTDDDIDNSWISSKIENRKENIK